MGIEDEEGRKVVRRAIGVLRLPPDCPRPAHPTICKGKGRREDVIVNLVAEFAGEGEEVGSRRGWRGNHDGVWRE